MAEELVVHEILHASIHLETVHGAPTEEAVRMALEGLFTGLAMRIRHMGLSDKVLFPLIFPMRMTMTSEQLRWDFQLKLKLENYTGISKREKDTDGEGD